MLGCDGAGVVTQVGSSASRLAEGDEVYFCYGGIGGTRGCYAEYVAVPERFVARKPAKLSFREAAAAPLVLITAWEALHDRVQIKSGKRVLILGGTGGVGHVATQLARNSGLAVAATVGSPEKAEISLRLGAELAILYKTTEVAESVREWSSGRGVEYLLDTVSGEFLTKAMGALAVYGKAVSILAPTKELPWRTIMSNNLGFFVELMLTPQMLSLDDEIIRQRTVLERCAEMFDAGELEILVEESFNLEDAREVHRRMETASTAGKLVFEMS